MGEVGRGTQVEGSGRFPAARREESSISGARRVWEKLKEKLSGAHRLPEDSVSEKTPIPSSENDSNYRMICLQKMGNLIAGLRKENMFWEQDFGTVMGKARAAFDPKGNGSDQINQELCARMLGVSFQMLQMGRLELFVKAGGSKYIEWGASNLMEPDMRELADKVRRKIAQLPEPQRVS